VGGNVGCVRDQKHFLLESWYLIDMIPGSAKNVHMCIVLQWFVPVMWGWGKGGGELFLLKIMVDECGYFEVWRDFFLNIFLRNVVPHTHWK